MNKEKGKEAQLPDQPSSPPWAREDEVAHVVGPARRASRQGRARHCRLRPVTDKWAPLCHPSPFALLCFCEKQSTGGGAGRNPRRTRPFPAVRAHAPSLKRPDGRHVRHPELASQLQFKSRRGDVACRGPEVLTPWRPPLDRRHFRNRHKTVCPHHKTLTLRP